MATSVFDRYEVRFLAEAHGSFSAPHADVNDWDLAVRVRATKADIGGLVNGQIDDAATLLRAHDERGVILGAQSGSRFTFSTYLTGKGGVGAVAPTTRPLWLNALGGASYPGGALPLCAAGCTATVLNVVDSANITVGEVYWFGVRGDTRGDGQARAVIAKTGAPGHTVTLGLALPGAPADLDTIAGGDTYYIDPGNIGDYSDAGYTSLAMLFRDAAHRAQMLGCKPTFKIGALTPGGIIAVDWDALVNSWSFVADPGDPAADATDDGEIVAINGRLTINEVGTTTYKHLHVADFSFDAGLEWAGMPSPAGTQGVAAFCCNRSKSRITVRPYADHAPSDGITGDLSDWQTRFEVGTAVHAILEFGSAEGTRFALYVPNAIVEAPPKRADATNLVTADLSLRLREGALTTTDLTRSKFRLAIG